MRTPRSLFALTVAKLLDETRSLLAARAENTADLLQHLAEIDSRRLYEPAAFPSMLAFCVGELRMAEDSAEKKIQAVRAIQRCPALLDAIADGKLTLSAVNLIASRLTPENVGELVTLAAHRSCAEIRARLVESDRASAPTPDLLAQVAANPRCEPDSNQVMCSSGEVMMCSAASSPTPAPPPHRTLVFTVPAELADAYREALALASYEIARDPAKAFAHMLAAWRTQLEKRRCAATSRPARRRSNGNGRSVPAEVRRAVWERDSGRCTFVSDKGRRCERRHQLELDHVTPIARGGRSTVDNLRLRCRQHNQLEAERVFGKRFVEEKRDAARAASEQAHVQRAAMQVQRECEREAAAERQRAAAEVEPYLRRLGLGTREARDLAIRVSGNPEQSLEERVRAALRTLGPCGTRAPAA